MSDTHQNPYKVFEEKIKESLAEYLKDPRPDSPALEQMNALIDEQCTLNPPILNDKPLGLDYPRQI